MKNAKKLIFFSVSTVFFFFLFSVDSFAQTQDSDPMFQSQLKLEKAHNDVQFQIHNLDEADPVYQDGMLKMQSYELMISNIGTYSFEDAKMTTILELSGNTVDEADYQNNTLSAELQAIKIHLDQFNH